MGSKLFWGVDGVNKGVALRHLITSMTGLLIGPGFYGSMCSLQSRVTKPSRFFNGKERGADWKKPRNPGNQIKHAPQVYFKLYYDIKVQQTEDGPPNTSSSVEDEVAAPRRAKQCAF
ncbi:hypothetical protein GWK47_006560 [Chionoecetes opilio]|uniref:Uncharacterized protein n=1 Tax=Chionoecetes opilio TaxID=41210 RepID=A0A8J4YC47_CHIOP|nr:hypothetical protein GWK47_006560 [Chionoecetes opilio]